MRVAYLKNLWPEPLPQNPGKVSKGRTGLLNLQLFENQKWRSLYCFIGDSIVGRGGESNDPDADFQPLLGFLGILLKVICKSQIWESYIVSQRGSFSHVQNQGNMEHIPASNEWLFIPPCGNLGIAMPHARSGSSLFKPSHGPRNEILVNPKLPLTHIPSSHPGGYATRRKSRSCFPRLGTLRYLLWLLANTTGINGLFVLAVKLWLGWFGLRVAL